MLHPLKKTTQSFLPCTSQATPDIALSAYNATNHTNMQAIGKQTLQEISLKCVNGQLSEPTNTTKLCQRELFCVWERPVGTLIWDPGAVRGGGKKSKRAKKKFGRTKLRS